MAAMDKKKPTGTSWKTLTRETAIRRVFWFDEISSTMDAAKDFLSGNGKSPPSPRQLPALFIANRQVAGRGRGSHSWWSPDGGLFLSLVASRRDFGLTDDDSVELSIKVARGVAQTVSAFLSQKTAILSGKTEKIKSSEKAEKKTQ